MLNSLLETPIAHRGLHNGKDRPENSLSAFSAAMSHGFPIELDLRPLNDSTAVAFHDRRLERLTGKGGKIDQLGRRDLEQFRLCGTDEKIPLFDEVLELVGGEAPLLIELKSFGPAGKFEERLFDQLSSYQGAFAVQSFNPESVAWFRLNAPSFKRGLICEDYTVLDREWIARSGPDFIACGLDGLPFVRLELPLLVWTVRSEQERLQALELADNIIFEDFMPESKPLLPGSQPA